MLIRALSSNPDLLVLDEPFEGLDIESYSYLNSLLSELAFKTRIVLVLNRFDEIPDFVTHIAFMDNGRLASQIDRSDREAMNNLEKLVASQNNRYTHPRSR